MIRRGGMAGCDPGEDSRGPIHPFIHSFTSLFNKLSWAVSPATLCRTLEHREEANPSPPWGTPRALPTLLCVEPGLGPGSLDQIVWLTGYRDWAGGPVMPSIKIKQPVDGDSTIELGNTRKNTGKARDLRGTHGIWGAVQASGGLQRGRGQETHRGLQARGRALGTVGVERALMPPCRWGVKLAWGEELTTLPGRKPLPQGSPGHFLPPPGAWWIRAGLQPWGSGAFLLSSMWRK